MSDIGPQEPLPEHLLADSQFVAACAQRHMGAVFRLAKVRAGIYPARIARLTGMSTSRITEIINGNRVITSMEVVERIADGLRIPGRLLGLADRQWETPAVPDYSPATVPETWEILDLLTRSTASDATLLHLEAAVADLAYRYPSSSPAETVPTMQRQLTAVHQLLSRPQSLSARRRCVQILTVLSGLLGLAYLDTGEGPRSAALFHMGQVAIGEAQDDALQAWLLTMQSIAEHTAGRAQHALTLLAQADSLAGGASTRRRAWIAANYARALTAQRDHRPALTALTRAGELLAQASDPIGGLDFFTPPRLTGLAGETHALLGDHDAAADLLTDALELRDRADAKGRAILTFDLAECRIRQGDLDAACTLGHLAMDIAQGSVVEPLIRRAQAFQHTLRPLRADAPVREVEERVRESKHQLVRV